MSTLNPLQPIQDNVHRLVAAHTARTYNNSSQNQRYRDSSIYNKFTQIQVKKEQAFKLREIQLREKYENMDPEKLRQLFPVAGNQSTCTFEEIYNNPMSPSALHKQTYFEIFQSKKDAMKKPLNFINYTKQNYDVINNDCIDHNYASYLDKKIDYEAQIPKYKQYTSTQGNWNSGVRSVNLSRLDEPDKHNKIVHNRKLMQQNMKSHILSNIRKIRNLSKPGSSLGGSSSKRGEHSTGMSNAYSSQDQKRIDAQKDKGLIFGNGRQFNIKDFYKIIDSTTHKAPIAYQQPRTSSVIQERPKREVFQIGEVQRLTGNAESVSVVGRKNSIKENAYSDIESTLRYNEPLQKRASSSAISRRSALTKQDLMKLARGKEIGLKQEILSSKSVTGIYDEAGLEAKHSALQKRWSNLEKYIGDKKNQTLKDAAYSHASEVLTRYENSTKKAPTTVISEQFNLEHNEALSDEDANDHDSEDEDDSDNESETSEKLGNLGKDYQKRLAQLQDDLLQEKKRREKLEAVVNKMKLETSKLHD